jgi:hypothetical protein
MREVRERGMDHAQTNDTTPRFGYPITCSILLCDIKCVGTSVLSRRNLLSPIPIYSSFEFEWDAPEWTETKAQEVNMLVVAILIALVPCIKQIAGAAQPQQEDLVSYDLIFAFFVYR